MAVVVVVVTSPRQDNVAGAIPAAEEPPFKLDCVRIQLPAPPLNCPQQWLWKWIIFHQLEPIELIDFVCAPAPTTTTPKPESDQVQLINLSCPTTALCFDLKSVVPRLGWPGFAQQELVMAVGGTKQRGGISVLMA